MCRSFWTALIEIVCTQFAIGLIPLDKMIADYQNRMCHRHESPAYDHVEPPADDTERPDRCSCMGGTVSGLHQNGLQGRIALTRFARTLSACTFMVAGSDTRQADRASAV